jgi:hypothetical protein
VRAEQPLERARLEAALAGLQSAYESLQVTVKPRPGARDAGFEYRRVRRPIALETHSAAGLRSTTDVLDRFASLPFDSDAPLAKLIWIPTSETGTEGLCAWCART